MLDTISYVAASFRGSRNSPVANGLKPLTLFQTGWAVFSMGTVAQPMILGPSANAAWVVSRLSPSGYLSSNLSGPFV